MPFVKKKDLPKTAKPYGKPTPPKKGGKWRFVKK